MWPCNSPAFLRRYRLRSTPSGSLDLARLRSALPRWIESPLSGFVVLGTNGEAGLLTDSEAASVIEMARSEVPHGRTLIAGTARESTREAIAAARQAAALGVDAVLVRTPCFFKGQMTGAAFERHYSAVADASPVPVLLYNFTAATGVNLQPDDVARLASHPEHRRHQGIGERHRADRRPRGADAAGFAMLAGSASTFYAALCAGVTGGILALRRVAARRLRQAVSISVHGHQAEARRSSGRCFRWRASSRPVTACLD